MLPIQRWPEFLYRVSWALIAPHRAALDYNRRIERQWSINRDLNFEVHRLTGEISNQERATRETVERMSGEFRDAISDEQSRHRDTFANCESERRRLVGELSAEQSRHAETAQLLRLQKAENECLARQIELDQVTIQQGINTLEALARIEETKGRRKQSEE